MAEMNFMSIIICLATESGNSLSSMYVKNPNAPPLAPRLMKRTTSTQSFMSLGVGLAFLSIRKVMRIRASGQVMSAQWRDLQAR